MGAAALCQLTCWHRGGCLRARMPYCLLMAIHNSEMFNSVLESLHQFCIEMDADWCMVYDYMEAHLGTLTEEQWDEVEMVYFNYNNDSRY